jgi:hypothetical protein
VELLAEFQDRRIDFDGVDRAGAVSHRRRHVVPRAAANNQNSRAGLGEVVRQIVVVAPIEFGVVCTGALRGEIKHPLVVNVVHANLDRRPRLLVQRENLIR